MFKIVNYDCFDFSDDDDLFLNVIEDDFADPCVSGPQNIISELSESQFINKNKENQNNLPNVAANVSFKENKFLEKFKYINPRAKEKKLKAYDIIECIETNIINEENTSSHLGSHSVVIEDECPEKYVLQSDNNADGKHFESTEITNQSGLYRIETTVPFSESKSLYFTKIEYNQATKRKNSEVSHDSEYLTTNVTNKDVKSNQESSKDEFIDTNIVHSDKRFDKHLQITKKPVIIQDNFTQTLKKNKSLFCTKSVGTPATQKITSDVCDSSKECFETNVLLHLHDKNKSYSSNLNKQPARNESEQDGRNIKFNLSREDQNYPLVSPEKIISRKRKRRFPGPAGIPLDNFEDLPSEYKVGGLEMKNLILPAKTSSYQIDSCSQLSSQEFKRTSWQNMQQEIAYNQNLKKFITSSNIKYILEQSFRKKLPKHVVVPILCVLVKTIRTKELEVTVVFKDETGEINGKISNEIVEKYGAFLQVGSVLILKKVTFLFNVLILKLHNVVSIYGQDGTIMHAQDWDGVLVELKSPESYNPELSGPSTSTTIHKISATYTNDPQRGTDTSKINKLNTLCSKSNIVEASFEKISDDFFDDIDELLFSVDEKSLLGET